MSSHDKSPENHPSPKLDETEEPKTSVEKEAPPESDTDTAIEQPSGSSTLPKLINSFVHSLEKALNIKEEKPQLVKALTIEGVADYIKEYQPRNVIFMVGAGISTSAGIPDFRSPGTGLYDNLQKYNLPHPQAIFELDFFHKDPEPFFELARELFPEKLKPTPCHYFIRLMDQKGLLRRCYTQNIDSLEFIAGIRSEKVVTAHGSHQTSTCLKCKMKYNLDWITAKLKDKSVKVPKCESKDCNGVVKPDIVFFGESLPHRFFTCAVADLPECDLLIIMGTPLKVRPFSTLIFNVGENVPRLLFNNVEAGKDLRGERLAADGCELLEVLGLRYDEEDNTRDVFWKGTCDDGAWKFAELLGWKSELKALIDKEWTKIDAEKTETTKVTYSS